MPHAARDEGHGRPRDPDLLRGARGEGRPAVFIHGVVTDHRHVVAELEPAFEGRTGWRRIYPDLPGRGRTPGADWVSSQDDILAVTSAFIDAVAPGQRFALGGVSWGGYVVLGLLHERGRDVDGALLVVANPLRSGRTTAEHRVLVREEAAIASLADDEKDWVDYAVVQTAETLRANRETIDPAIADADMAFIERVEERTEFSFDVRQLRPFDHPTLIISGRQDPMAGYVDMLGMLETFPRATHVIMDRAGHAVAVEAPALFRSLVGDWLDRLEAEQRR